MSYQKGIISLCIYISSLSLSSVYDNVFRLCVCVCIFTYQLSEFYSSGVVDAHKQTNSDRFLRMNKPQFFFLTLLS